MPTPHNAAEKGQIAKVVLMPGDPLRAQYVAEHYLDDYTCFNKVRNMLGFTGTYHGVPVSVMGSGMGIPSIAIYSYELFSFYDVGLQQALLLFLQMELLPLALQMESLLPGYVSFS